MESPGKLSKVPCKTLYFHTPRKHLKPGTALDCSLIFCKTLNFMDIPGKPSKPGTILELSLLYRKPGITCIVLANLQNLELPLNCLRCSRKPRII